MRYIKLLIMLILLSIAAVGNCQNLQKAGETDVGVLYVDVDSVQSLSKSGQLYLAVFAEEQFTDAEFLCMDDGTVYSGADQPERRRKAADPRYAL